MKTQGSKFARLRKSLVLATLMAMFLASFSQQANAQTGREDHLEGHKLVIHVDSRWVGCRMGGYYPIRISLLNSSAERTLRIRFDPVTGNLPTVEKKILLPQNEKVFTTISIPIVGDGRYGRLHFLEDNKVLEALSCHVEFPDNDPDGSMQPACLVISEQKIDLSVFQRSLVFFQVTRSNVQNYWEEQQPSDLSKSEMRTLAPVMLPSSWIDYSGVDIVFIPADTLAKLDTVTRQAILKWTQTGGTLIVYENGKLAFESVEINRFLFPEATDLSTEWHRVKSRVQIRGLDRRSNWPKDDGFVQKHGYSMGNVFVFRDNPFQGSSRGTTRDWHPFLVEVNPVTARWFERMGLSAREPSGNFLSFLIKGIKSIPVIDFLILITLFTLLIGPLNYFILWKRKKLFLLIATIPAIAFVTSLMLFGYSIFSNGLGVKSRIRSVTILDQRTQTAVTSSRFALYAGMTPSEGLVFSNDTAVFPIWPNNKQFESAHVKWDDRQHFDYGWIRSRTRTQFLSITNRRERRRLEVEKLDENFLRVANGFDFEISKIVISDDDGNLFGRDNLEAGAQVNLSPAGSNFWKGFLKEIDKNNYRKEKRPSTAAQYEHYDSRSRRGFMDERRIPINIILLQKNKSERILKEAEKNIRENQRLPSRMYIAILKSNPGVEIGVENTTEKSGFHVLIGYY